MTSIIDFAPLAQSHFQIFLAAFVATYVAIAAVIHERPKSLAVAQSKAPLSYVGVILLGVMTAGALIIIDSWMLRIGFALASFLTLLVGRSDEEHPLPASRQFVWQIVIVMTLVSFGWTIPYVSNPWGEGVISLSQFAIGGWVLPGSLIAAVWLLFIMNAFNWVDGLDGLAGGIGSIAFLALAAVSLLPSIQDSQMLSLALLGAGASLAFLIWNFPPAKVYMGTTGSWFISIFIALIAMQGGGKIVTTALVLALPIIDAILVMLQRLLAGQAMWKGDKEWHFHYRLLNIGLPPSTVTIAAIVITAALAVTSVVGNTQTKALILSGIFAGSLLLFSFAWWLSTYREALKRKFIKHN